MRPRCWERKDLDRRKDRLNVVLPPVVPKSYKTISHNDDDRTNSNTTIINLSENGTVINNTSIPLRTINENLTSTSVHVENADHVTVTESSKTTNKSKNNIRLNVPETESEFNTERSSYDPSKVTDICFVSRKIETKTVTVEVHRNPSEDNCKITSPPPPPPPLPCTSDDRHSSLSSSLSIPSYCDGSSLSSAISDELKKRADVNFMVLF